MVECSLGSTLLSCKTLSACNCSTPTAVVVQILFLLFLLEGAVTVAAVLVVEGVEVVSVVLEIDLRRGHNERAIPFHRGAIYVTGMVWYGTLHS